MRLLGVLKAGGSGKVGGAKVLRVCCSGRNDQWLHVARDELSKQQVTPWNGSADVGRGQTLDEGAKAPDALIRWSVPCPLTSSCFSLPSFARNSAK